MTKTDKKFDVWVATSIDLSKALFHRMTIDSIEMLGEMLLRAWRAVSFTTEISREGGELLTGQRYPDKYEHIQLYHIRNRKFLDKSLTLSAQHVDSGEVFVLLRDDDAELDGKLGFITAQAFPFHIPPVPVWKKMLTITEIQEITETRSPLNRKTVTQAPNFSDVIDVKPGVLGITIDVKKLLPQIVRAFKGRKGSG